MTDLSLIAEQEWNEARRRAFVLRPLVEFKHCPRNRAHEAAVELGLSERQVYRLIRRRTHCPIAKRFQWRTGKTAIGRTTREFTPSPDSRTFPYSTKTFSSRSCVCNP